MINRITFKNYRIFKSKQDLEIKPITIIFGKNNSGKSAVLKLPLLIKNSLECKSNEVFELEDTLGTRLCQERKDVVYNRGFMPVSIDLADTQHDLMFSYSFVVDSSTINQESNIEKWALKNEESKWVIERKDSLFYSIHHNTEAPVDALLNFEGVCPTEFNGTEISKLVDSLRFNLDYIAAIRCTPENYQTLSKPVKEHSFADGRNNYQHLLLDSTTNNKFLIEKVSQWYESYFDGWKLEIDQSRQPICHIGMRHDDMMKQTSIKAHISDTGVGIIQSLPIITRVCRPCSTSTLIVLEEPESHLHPAAHAGMAQLIADSTLEDHNKRYLIETHSQNFLLRLRRLVAEGYLPLDSIALYYVEFDTSNRTSNLKQVKLHEDGSVGNWPKGVFEETLPEAIAIRKAQRQV